MTDLIQKIMQETGLDEATARKTVDITGSYLKKRMPEVLADRMDDLLKGESLGDSFKEKARQTATVTRDQLEEAFKDMSEKTSEAVDQIKDRMDRLFEKKK